MKKIEDYVMSIPNFPEEGIIFRDVTSVLQDAEGLHLAIDLIQEKLKGLEFDVEYGSASIEIHKDAIQPGQKVVIIDDLIATGGTTEAMVKLVEMLGGTVVKIVYLMELAGLCGREKVPGYDVESVIVYPGK